MVVAVLTFISGCDAPRPTPTKLELSALADKLAETNRLRNGDAALAGLKSSTDLLASLNERRDVSSGCLRAAVGLVDQFSDLVRGSQTGSQANLHEDLKQCP